MWLHKGFGLILHMSGYPFLIYISLLIGQIHGATYSTDTQDVEKPIEIGEKQLLHFYLV